MEQQISWGLDEAHVLWETCRGVCGPSPESVSPFCVSMHWHKGRTRLAQEDQPPPSAPTATHTYPSCLAPPPQPSDFPGRSVESSSALDSRHPSEGGVRVRGWGWPRLLRVTYCCRSVPRAWWMKTPSNSFTHSSSLREVSLRPDPCSRFSRCPHFVPMAALQRAGVPLWGGDPHPHLYAPHHHLLPGGLMLPHPIGRGYPSSGHRWTPSGAA